MPRLITFALTITRISNKSFITHTFINQFFTFTSACIIIPALFVIAVYLLVLILKGNNTSSSLLTLTVCGLTIHYSLFIEIQLRGAALNEFTHTKVDKNTSPVKKTTFNKPKHFIILFHSFSLNSCKCLKHRQVQ